MSLGKEYEKEQMDRILKFEKALTPEGRFRLRGKLREAKALTKLLSKPREKRTKKDKEEIQEYYSKLSNAVRVSQLGMKPTHQNMKAIGEEEHQLAKLVQASKVYSDHRYGGLSHEQAEKLTNEYINNQEEGHPNLEGWKMDGDLTNRFGGEDSNYRGAVFEKDGKAFSAFRGTKFGLSEFGAEDVALDADIISSGKVPRHPQISQADQMVKEAVEKYGRTNVKTGGYSLGGFKAIHSGNMNRVDSVSFNPLTQGNAILDDSSHPMGIKHRIIKTPDDFASLNAGALKAKYPNRYDIKSVGSHADIKYGEGWRIPFTDIDTGFSPSNIKSYAEHTHKLGNFVEDHKLRNDEHTAYYRHMERGVNQKTKHHHLERFKNMVEHNGEPEEGFVIPESNIGIDDEPDTLIDRRTRPPTRNPLREDRLRARGFSVDAPIVESRRKRIQVVDKKRLEMLKRKRQIGFKEATDKRQQLQNELDDLNERYNPETFNDEDWNKTAKERLDTAKGTAREAQAKAQVMEVNRDLERRSTLKSMLSKPKPKMDNRPFTEAETERWINEKLPVRFKLPPTEKIPPQLPTTGIPFSNQRPDIAQQFTTEPPQRKKMSFTEYANERNVSATDKNKYLWEQSGGTLNEAEKSGYDKILGKEDVGINEKELNDFKELGRQDRQNHLDNIENQARGDFNILEQAQNATGRSGEGIFTDGLATGFKRMGVGTAKGVAQLGKEGLKGAGFGLAGTGLRKYGEYSTGIKLNKPEANLVDATLSAGMYSRYLGGSTLKGGLAGLGSTAIGMGTEYGTTKGLEKLGVSKSVAKGVGATTGGVASGASFVGLSSALGADALLGAEAGAELGLPGILIGGAVGGIIGLGSYFASK
tara:strand:- start:7171 stop:9780 length:2610 start_codon:yes stop_codon:yes gene_type:complete